MADILAATRREVGDESQSSQSRRLHTAIMQQKQQQHITNTASEPRTIPMIAPVDNPPDVFFGVEVRTC